ncbi:MAG: ABC transporter substrate-binding protein [Dethiobacteria bacterium]|jgi:branched-chain amino acid transport system substrate-binding protein
MKSRKRTMFVAAAAVLCLVLLAAIAGCAPKEPANGGDETTEIKIGMVGPLSGDAAAYGINILRAAEIAIEEANASGELGDITLKIISEDTEGDWAKAANAFTKLIDVDGVSVIIGGVLSSESEAGSDIVKDAAIPTISPSSTSVDLTKGNPYLFRNCLSDEVQAVQLAEFAVEELGMGKFAILFTKNDYGESLRDAFKNKAEELAEVVAVESFMDKDNDFKAQITKIKEKNPDCLYIAGYYTEAAKIAQQAQQAGMDIQLLGADGLCNVVFLEVGEDAVEGTYATSGFYPDDPMTAVQDFVKAYKDKHGEEPDMFAAQGYDAARIVIEAIKSKGTTSEQIREGIAATADFPGITGKTSLDEEGDTIKDVLILKVENGKFVRVR